MNQFQSKEVTPKGNNGYQNETSRVLSASFSFESGIWQIIQMKFYIES
jgi:hypothetical protein